MSEGSLSRALRWPLWSWRNLAVTAAGLLLVGMAVGRLVGGPGAEPAGPGTAGPALGSATGSSAGASPAPAATAGTDPSAGAPASPPAAGSASSTPDEARAEAGARTAAAERAGLFVQAWLKPGTPTQRADALRPLAADRLVAQLAGLPASALAVHPVGAPVVVSVDQAEAAVTVAMSDGRTAVLAMTAEADGWRVSSLSTTSTGSSVPTASSSAAAAPSPAAAG